MSSNRFLKPRQSRAFVEKRRKRLTVGLVAFAVIILTWGFVLSRLSFLPALEITHVKAYGDDLLAPQMESAASAALDGAYLGLFSKSNILIYLKSEVIRSVASTSPRIDTVTVTRDGLNGLAVSISQRSPEAVICADLPDISDAGISMSDECYLADADSYLYKTAGADDASRYMRYYMPDLPDSGILGIQATSTEQFKRLEGITRSIGLAGINIHAMLVKGGGDYEIYADNPDGASMVVIQLNDRAGLDLERDNLIAFWNRMVSDARAAKKSVAWSEIKLQFPPNVYSRPLDDKLGK